MALLTSPSLRLIQTGATSCRAGIAPAEDQRPIMAHQNRWATTRPRGIKFPINGASERVNDFETAA